MVDMHNKGDLVKVVNPYDNNNGVGMPFRYEFTKIQTRWLVSTLTLVSLPP